MTEGVRDASPYYRYCGLCGSRLATRVLRDGDMPRRVCSECGFVAYLDPKLAVGTIIADGQGRVLLIRRAIEPGYGRWVFPGGFVERGEEVREAARREALEESGLTVSLDYLLDVYSYPGRVPVVVVFAATRTGGRLSWDDEGLDGRFFASTEIPWNDLAFRTTHEAVRDYFARTAQMLRGDGRSGR